MHKSFHDERLSLPKPQPQEFVYPNDENRLPSILKATPGDQAHLHYGSRNHRVGVKNRQQHVKHPQSKGSLQPQLATANALVSTATPGGSAESLLVKLKFSQPSFSRVTSSLPVENASSAISVVSIADSDSDGVSMDDDPIPPQLSAFLDMQSVTDTDVCKRDDMLRQTNPSNGSWRSDMDAMQRSTSELTDLLYHMGERLKAQQQDFRTACERLQDLEQAVSIDSAIQIHPESKLRSRLSVDKMNGQLDNETSLEGLNDRFENLRRLLMYVGVWYGDVDTILKYCDTDAADVAKSDVESSFVPANIYPLGLHKATCLDPKLGISQQVHILGIDELFEPLMSTSTAHHNSRTPSTTRLDNGKRISHKNFNLALPPSRPIGDARESQNNIGLKQRTEQVKSSKTDPLIENQHGKEQPPLQRTRFQTRNHDDTLSNIHSDIGLEEQPVFASLSDNGDDTAVSIAYEEEDTINLNPAVTPMRQPDARSFGEAPLTVATSSPKIRQSLPAQSLKLILKPNKKTPTAKQGTEQPVHSVPAKGDPWNEEEYEFLMATFRSLELVGYPDSQCLNMAIKEMIDQGYSRAETSIRTKWYTRLRPEYRKRFPGTKHQHTIIQDPLALDRQPHAGAVSQYATGPTQIKETVPQRIMKPQTIRHRISGPNQLQPRAYSSNLKSAGYLKRRLLGKASSKTQAGLCQNLDYRLTWTGASGDVLKVDWSPDGSRFLAGAAAITDHQNFHYNRPNNLLYGNLVRDCLTEIPDHRVSRSAEISRISDPWTYATVSQVQWSDTGTTAFTSSYDKTVKIWDMRNYEQPSCMVTLKHSHQVVVMAASVGRHNLLVTGMNNGFQSLRGYFANTDGSNFVNLTTAGLTGMKKLMGPTCLRFGLCSASDGWMVGGFGSSASTRDGRPAEDGWLGLWTFEQGRIAPISFPYNTQNVFDVAWSPTMPVFAAAMACDPEAKTATKCRSVVRLYSANQHKLIAEHFLTALDINDVAICPYNELYICAACTDGTTYVWDRRQPDETLHVLSHDRPVSDLARGVSRDIADVGVNVLQWGSHAGQLYTGSSDGVLKEWDILQSQKQALVRDVASFGIELMSGKFSPDKSQLLLGDASGSVHLLTRNTDSETVQPHQFAFRRAENQLAPRYTGKDPHVATRGRDAARELIETGQIEIHPTYGPGQGQDYKGPFAAWARPAGSYSNFKNVPLLPEIQEEQRDRTKYALKRVLAKSRSESRHDRQVVSGDKRVCLQPELAFDKTLYHFTSDEHVDIRDWITADDRPEDSDNQGSMPITSFPSTDVDTGDAHLDEIDAVSSTSDDWFPPHWTVDANLEQLTT